MKQNKNMPYVHVDTQHEEDRVNAVASHVEDDRLDEEPVVKMEHSIPFSKVLFFDNSDFHYGGQGYESKRANLALEIESKYYNGIMGIGGDFFDNANMESATNIYGMRVSPSNAMAGAKAMLERYKDNLAFFLGGNHDSAWGNRNKSSNIGPEEELARSLGVPHARYSLVMTLNLLDPDNAKVKKMTVCLKHEVKDPQKLIGYLAKQGIVPDVIIREHTHNGNDGIFMTTVPVYNKDGTLKGYENHQVLVLTGKSMQNGNTYYGAENNFDLKTNAKGLMLSWDKNPYYTADDVTQPRYIPKAVPFDVLHKTENKPSKMAEILMHYYERPNIEDYKKNTKDMSLGQVASSYDAINRRTKKKLESFVNYEKTKNMGE